MLSKPPKPHFLNLLSLNCIRFLRLDGIDEGSLGVVINNAFIAVDRVAKKGEDLGDDFEEIALPKLENNTSKANKSVIYQPIEDGIVKKWQGVSYIGLFSNLVTLLRLLFSK